ncbi:MAG: membrane dipeptidase [Thermodesulfobacteriota bacterium]
MVSWTRSSTSSARLDVARSATRGCGQRTERLERARRARSGPGPRTTETAHPSTTAAPVIASHSATRALADHPRNMDDDMLRAVARNGGVVMVNLQDVLIDPEKASVWKALSTTVWNLGWPRTPLAGLLDHMDHAVAVAGIDHVGVGSDFASTFFMPEGLTDVAGYPNITLGLVERGYPDDAARKVLGENVLRALSKAKATRDRLRDSLRP